MSGERYRGIACRTRGCTAQNTCGSQADSTRQRPAGYAERRRRISGACQRECSRHAGDKIWCAGVDAGRFVDRQCEWKLNRVGTSSIVSRECQQISAAASGRNTAKDARTIPEEITLVGETTDTLTPPLTVEVITSRDWSPSA